MGTQFLAEDEVPSTLPASASRSVHVAGVTLSAVCPRRKPAWKDGSTATCVLAVDNVLYIANLGDSRVCGRCARPDASTP